MSTAPDLEALLLDGILSGGDLDRCVGDLADGRLGAEPALSTPDGPEVFKAGFWDRSSGSGVGFASGGTSDRMPPGAVLAWLAEDTWQAGLDRLNDDELIGILRAARRLASWANALELSAAGDLLNRRWAEQAAGEAGVAEHASDELAAALVLTARAAGRLEDQALALRRLPATMRALAAGEIDLPRAMVIVDEVSGLSDAHAAIVEQVIIKDAPGQTTGQLRAAVRRAVIAADPAAARARKERAEREARVERWDEPSGTAGLAGRDLPAPDVLAADSNITAIARELRAAGLEGSMDNLRAQVFLALLAGRSPYALVPSEPGEASVASAGLPVGPVGRRDGHAKNGVAGAVNLTMPVSAWLGLSEAPGEVAGFGPLDAGDSRDLLERLAMTKSSRWCLTLTDAYGQPVAHGCARTGPGLGLGPNLRSGLGPGSGPSPSPSPGLGLGSGPSLGLGSGPSPSLRPGLGLGLGSGPGPGSGLRSGPDPGSGSGQACSPDSGSGLDQGFLAAAVAWLTAVKIEPLETGECGHRRESPAYRPPPLLQHLIRVRQRTCSFPGCRRPAYRCDLDHTIAYDQGGRTCLCNLAPLCRRHHQAKQANGWRLEQLQPGVMIWTTPSGHSYVTTPATYTDG